MNLYAVQPQPQSNDNSKSKLKWPAETKVKHSFALLHSSFKNDQKITLKSNLLTPKHTSLFQFCFKGDVN